MNLDFDESKLHGGRSPVNDRKPNNNTTRDVAIRRLAKSTWCYIKYLSRSVRIFLFDVVLIEGTEKHSGQSLKTLYVGETKVPSFRWGKFYSKSEAIDRYDNFKFHIDNIYKDYNILLRNKNISGLRICRELSKYEGQADMVLIDTELLFVHMLEKERYLAIPEWVSLKLKIHDRWEDVIKCFHKNLREKINRILKQGYRYSADNTDSFFQYFYHEMYLPYTKSRFGDAASLLSADQIKNILQSGEILLVLQENLVLHGTLNKYDNDRVLLICNAPATDIQPGKFKGTAEAMVYFSLLSAYEKGCHEADFLGSRPLLDNGALRFKRKWGIYIEKFDMPLADICFRPLNLNAGVKSYLAHNPLIIKTPEGFRGRVLLDSPAGVKDIQKCINRYQIEGLIGIDFFCIAGINGNEKISDDKDFQIRVYDVSNSRNPERDFCELHPNDS